MQQRVQAPSLPTAHVVMRGASPAPWYRRRVPERLRPALGASTITVRLAGRPDGTPAERRQFAASYARADAGAEQRLAEAASPRVLTPAEQWGAAGVWAKQQTTPPLAEPDDADACRAVLQAAGAVESTPSYGFIPPPPAHWFPPPEGWPEPGPPITADKVRAWLQEALDPLQPFVEQAQTTLRQLGVVVPPEQTIQVAARLAAAARALAIEHLATDAGQIPRPQSHPPPPLPTGGATLEQALTVWRNRRSPTAKTAADAQSRLQELAAHAGTDQLVAITGEHISRWRDDLLKTAAPAKVKRQPFGLVDARRLWRASRSRAGNTRALDRWAIPLGLSLGARLEEIAGIRPSDVRQIDGIPVVVIEPHERRRLNSDSSTRSIPIPEALITEGFIDWAQQQSGLLLFPEPEPPDTDPRLSHYVSIRLGKIIRAEGIADPAKVFHSCRHFATQSLTDAGVEERVIAAITGHATRSMAARYSRNGPPLHLLAAAMERRDWSWVPPLQG